jgi:hypothetical protein
MDADLAKHTQWIAVLLQLMMIEGPYAVVALRQHWRWVRTTEEWSEKEEAR